MNSTQIIKVKTSALLTIWILLLFPSFHFMITEGSNPAREFMFVDLQCSSGCTVTSFTSFPVHGSKLLLVCSYAVIFSGLKEQCHGSYDLLLVALYSSDFLKEWWQLVVSDGTEILPCVLRIVSTYV